MGGCVSFCWLMRVCVLSAWLPVCEHVTVHLCLLIQVFASIYRCNSIFANPLGFSNLHLLLYTSLISFFQSVREI